MTGRADESILLKDRIPLLIVHLTTLHPRFDTRIYVKEARTLANHINGKVIVVVADGRGDVDAGAKEVSYRDLGYIEGGRLQRMILGPWRAFWTLRKLAPDLVHFHDPELIPLALLLKTMGIKVVYDVHEDLPGQIMDKFWIPAIFRKPVSLIMSRVESIAARIFDAIVAATPKIESRFPPSKTMMVQNYPIITEMLIQNSTPYQKRPPSFVYAGVITRERGAFEMVKALGYLDTYSDAKLELAGTFSPTDLEAKLHDLPEWSSVCFHGFVGRKRLASLLGAAKAGLVLFHPLPNHIESQPNKMFEYMSAGIPIIASNFPWWREIIEKEKCGLLVNPLDAEEIAKAMWWILEYPEEAELMGMRGRKAVERKYNWDTEAVKLVKLYNEFIKKPK